MAIKYSTIDEYHLSFPKDTQEILAVIRKTISAAAPDAKETISYNMPAFKQNGMLVYYAAYKNHIGFYALPSGNAAFKKELSKYKTGKGSIQFPIDEPMPLDLIHKMVKMRVQENLNKAKK
ncbi:MAG: DUF1801 domain-containing protein [Flavipsychrobacter sp.]